VVGLVLLTNLSLCINDVYIIVFINIFGKCQTDDRTYKITTMNFKPIFSNCKNVLFNNLKRLSTPPAVPVSQSLLKVKSYFFLTYLKTAIAFSFYVVRTVSTHFLFFVRWGRFIFGRIRLT